MHGSATELSPPRESLSAPTERESRYREVFSLDIRSLALFRISLGLCLLSDLIWRLPFIADFYTDEGLLPRVEAFRKMQNTWAMSLHLMSGEWWVQMGLFALAIVFAAGLVCGYRTRLCTVCSWLLFSSMHVRDPFVQYFADLVLQAFLFWAMFLPLNGRWSLDRLLNPQSRPIGATQFSWATQAYVLQLCFIYWFTATMKWDPSWLSDGSAVYYALSLDFSVRPFGHYLLGFPALLRLLSRATIALEFLGPFLLLFPVWTAQLRLVAVLLFVGFHAGLGLTMDLTGFAAVSIVGWLALIPGFVWDALDRKWSARLDLRVAQRRATFQEWAARLRLRSSGFGRLLSSPSPSAHLGYLSRVIVLVGLLMIFATSVSNVPAAGVRLPPFWVSLASSSQLNQMWAMYAGPPYTDDGWYVVDGILLNGRHADVWRGGAEPTTTKPADVPGSYRNPQWRAYLLRMYNARYYQYRGYFGQYLCRTWNRRHAGDERVNLVYIYFMLEKTVPPGQKQPPAMKDLVWRHYCFEKPADW
jgi:Vitamin K-dependent gamma-carboxylase